MSTLVEETITEENGWVVVEQQLSVRERAMAALAEIEEQRKREDEQKSRAAAAKLKRMLAETLGIDVEPQGSRITLDGLTFALLSTFDEYDRLAVVTGEREYERVGIDGWADVGRAIRTIEQREREANSSPPVTAAQLADARLFDALSDFVADAVARALAEHEEAR